METWLWIIAGVLAAYLAACAGFYFFHAAFIFWPVRRVSKSPANVGLVYADVTFQAEDGVLLRGWYLPAGAASSAPRPVILLCQGNGGNISDRLDDAIVLHGLGCDLLFFDYRGFGRSERRRLDEVVVNRDADAAWIYLTQARGVAPERIVVYGQSLGCAVAAALAARRHPAGLMLEGGFASLPGASARLFPWLPVRLLMRERFDTLDALRQVICPVLIAHSCEDRNVPFREGLRLYDAAHPPKVLVQLHGGHVEGFKLRPEAYGRAVRGFLRQTVQ